MSTVSNRFDHNRLISNREIRVFLSSTFVDLDEERSALIRLFDKIRYDVKKRDVYLSVVDLRWGVTEEECKEGKVISVCLNEIENSHPFFIGLLGNRYGYAPSEQDLRTNPELVERYPWIKSDIDAGLSITEIEMQYGALRQSGETDAAFFIKTSNDKDDNPRLTKLKEKIFKQDIYEVSSFGSIEELCEKVETAVYRIVDRHFPVKAFDLRWSQSAYLSDFTRFYICNPDAYSALDSFVQRDNERYMMITGESGVGKTALVANWIRERSTPNISIISYFIGDSISGTSKQGILNTVYLALKDTLQDDFSFDGVSHSKEDIEVLLDRHCETGRKLVIVIDALNQLLKQDKDSLFEWFPIIPVGVKVIFTTIEDDPFLKVFSRLHRVYHLNPLERQTRKEFIVSYLRPYGKKLSPSQLGRILDDHQNENTLVLKTLLNELICYGSYQHLDERIDYYLAADSFMDFFDKVLARLEQDYSRNQDIVKTVLSLVYLSKEGLSEEEILGITRFREIDWRLFFCAFYGNFITKKGLLSFSHQAIAQAIYERYGLADSCVARVYRESIIAYFDSCRDAERKTIELSYQYYKLDSCDKLYETILGFNAFSVLNSNDQWLLACYWRKLVNNETGYSLVDYLKLKGPEDSVIELPLYSIAGFIGHYFPNFNIEMQYYNCYLTPDNHLIGLIRSNSDFARQVVSGVALCCARVGKLDLALNAYSLLLDNYKNPVDRSNTLNAIGHIYETKGDYVRALDYYRQSIATSLKGDHVAHAINYISIAGIYKNQKKYEDAITYYLKAQDILETYSGSAAAGMGCYIGLGYIYGKLKQTDIAIDYVRKGLSLIAEEYGDCHPTCFWGLQNMASIYLNNDDYDNALKTFFRIVDTFEPLNLIKAKKWVKVFGDMGEIYFRKKEYNKAIIYYQKAIEVVDDESGMESEIAKMYGKISSIYYELKQYDDAADALEKAAEYIDDSEVPSGQKVQYYKSAGVLYRAAGRIDKALNSYEMALKYYYIPSLLTPKDGEVPVYDDPAEEKGVADIYQILKDYPESLERAFRSVIMKLGENHPFSVFQAYKCIAGAYYDKQDFAKALDAVKHIIKAFEETYRTNYQYHSQTCSIAGVLNVAMQRYDEAMAYFQRALEISYNLGENNPISAKVYFRIGQVFLVQNEFQQALSYFEKAVTMSSASSPSPDLESIMSLGLVNETLKKKDEAIRNYKTVVDLYDGNVWMADAYIKALSRLGNIYCSKQEELIAFEYFLRGADAYDETRHNEEETVYCCRMAASIAVKSSQEAAKTKEGYNNALRLLRDTYPYMLQILGSSNTETKIVKAWIEVMEKARFESLPWYKRLFSKKM